jgi:uncharacterized membrane protein
VRRNLLIISSISLILAALVAPLPISAAPAQSLAAQTQSSGMELAAVVMALQLLALAYTGVMFVRVWRSDAPVAVLSLPAWVDALTPALTVIGLGVAGYLTYVETRAVPAVCGPVGDCNAVQTSSYALLFGMLPVGLLGAAGYVAILVAWLWGRFRSDRLADYAPLAILAMTVFGVLFSVYLTWLELFVIRAVCMWCLTSAVIMAVLMLLATPPALASFAPGPDAS